jgi:hypothetical protein
VCSFAAYRRFVGGATGGNEFVGEYVLHGEEVCQTPAAGGDCSGDGGAAGSGSSVSRAHDLAHIGKTLQSATISACTITMDLDEIVCFMTD